MILDSPIISGSSTVTGNLTVLGTLTANVSGSTTSASYATNAETLDGLDSTSFTTTSSFNTASGSFSTRVTNLETASGSFSTRVTNNETTGSNLTSASSSFSARVTRNEATGSGLTTASGSFSTRVTNTEATASSLTTASSSFSTRTTNLETASGSFSTRTTNLETASGSFSTRVTSAEGSVSSLNSKSGSYATTGSNNFNGNQVITGSLTTTGTITAQTLNVQQVTSSIVYSSGSNIFGNSVSNTQQFTGSLQVSGSNHYVLGNVGVGTSSPGYRLHISGVFSTNPGAYVYGTTYGLVGIDRGSSASSAGINYYTTGSQRWFTGIYENTNNFGFYNVGLNSFPVVIQYTDGNVGIGTTSPSAKLDVRAGSSYPLILDSTQQYLLGLYSSGTAEWWLAVNGGDLKIHENGVGDQVIIKAGGNVGIGTTSPSNKLEVDGGLSAVALRVSTTNTGAGVASLILANSSKSAFNDGVKIAHGGGYTNITDLNNTNVMTWDMSNTRVGIGTTTPAGTLDVVGNISYVGNTNNSTFVVRNNGSYTGGGGSGATLNVSYGGQNIATITNTGTGQRDGIFTLRDEGVTKVLIAANNSRGGDTYFNGGGNVGIGTTSPKSIFDVSSVTPTVSIVSNLNSEATTDNQTLAAITFYKHYGIANGAGIRMLQAGGVNNYAQAHLTFLTTNDGNPYTATLYERMRVTSDGNVGIGTSSPSQKFEVVGGEIKAGRVDSSAEGGQVSFARASDNATGYYIDVYGSTSTPQLRFIDVSNASVRMTIDGSGKIGINNTSPNNFVDIYDTTYNSNTVGVLAARTRGGGTFITGRTVTAETSNQTLTIATMSSSGPNERIFIKVQVVNVSAVSNYGNVHVGYALWIGGGSSTVTTMTLDSGNSNINNTNVGTLSWSGNNLQYTTNRAGNYELNSITIWASARDTGVVS